MQNMTSGVYKITNTITGDFYIGSSCNIKQRWATHKSISAQKRQPNVKLYKAMAEFGLDNFKFEVLEETADLHNREQYWIEQLKPSYNSKRAKGWNTERYKEVHRRCCKEYYEIHRDERLAYNKAYRQAHRDNNRLCLYDGKTLTLRALINKFCRQGIPHSTLEAKKYLIVK